MNHDNSWFVVIDIIKTAYSINVFVLYFLKLNRLAFVFSINHSGKTLDIPVEVQKTNEFSLLKVYSTLSKSSINMFKILS